MPDYGKRYECFNCGCKFYDLHKSVAICPKCNKDQKDAPQPSVINIPHEQESDLPEPSSLEDLDETEPNVNKHTEDMLDDYSNDDPQELRLDEVNDMDKIGNVD